VDRKEILREIAIGILGALLSVLTKARWGRCVTRRIIVAVVTGVCSVTHTHQKYWTFNYRVECTIEKIVDSKSVKIKLLFW